MIGLLYFVLKHCVDKYNLCWVYSPSEINNQIHGLVIKLVIFSIVMLQLFQTIVAFLRSYLYPLHQTQPYLYIIQEPGLSQPGLQDYSLHVAPGPDCGGGSGSDVPGLLQEDESHRVSI